MQSRMDMLMQVEGEHGELLVLLDRVTEISFVRVRSHFRHTWHQHLEKKQRGSLSKSGAVSFLVAANFLAQRACYTAEAVSCLLWHGYADSAYELWRTMFNLELNVSSMVESPDLGRTAEKYLSAALEDLHRHEQKVADLGLKTAMASEPLEPSVERLREEFEGIEKQDGWIENKGNRKTATRAQLANMQFDYLWDYDLASKSAHGAAISTLKRPSVYFLEGKGELPPVTQSTRGIEIAAVRAAKSLCSITDKFVYGTCESVLPQEASWLDDSDRVLDQLVSVAIEGLSPEDPGPV